jgi:adenylate cyclase
VTAVFTDIAGFTALVETLPPAVLSALLNDYFGGMTDIVFAHGGTVTKIMGDAMLLLFGAPDDQPDHAMRAVACALAMDAFAERLRGGRGAAGVALGITRIGLHSGDALVGDFGGGRHFDYTAYGDTIHVAARLEAANKALGTRICASDAVVRRVPGFQGRPAGDLLLRGCAEPLAAHEPLTADRFALPATAAYAHAFGLLRARDQAAMPAFAALVGRQAMTGSRASTCGAC